MPHRLAAFIYDRAWWIIAACLLVTLGMASRLPLLEVKDTVEHFFLDGDPSLNYYHRFLDQFESDEFFLVAFATQDAYGEETLAVVRDLTARLEKIENIEQVISLTNVDDIRSSGDELDVAPLIGDRSLNAAERADVLQRAQRNPMIVGSIVAPDGRAVAVFGRTKRIPDDSQYRKALTAEVYEAIAAAVPKDTRAFAAGGPVFYTEYVQFVQRDLRTFTPLSMAVLSLLMIVVYRKWRAVWLPMVCILIALIWTLGVLQLMNRSLNLVTNIIPPLVLVIGLAVIVHVLNRYEEAYRRI
ncbi:MAG: MMPL family transporter, partial [Candidatus Lernaella stagnicola]|nr:MMPL family transporter [Candidatus Lernaella stagnicola]